MNATTDMNERQNIPDIAKAIGVSDGQADHEARAERIGALTQMRLILPRSFREVILGGLMEDIPGMRAEGCSDKILGWYVYLQVFYAIMQQSKAWNWVRAGMVAWIAGKILGASWIAHLMR